MGWLLDDTDGHEGSLIGLVACPDARRRGDGFRELTAFDDEDAAAGIYLQWLQVGCTCGWRSPRMEAPIGACWWPGHVETTTWYEAQARTIWRAHAIATTFANRERQKAAIP